MGVSYSVKPEHEAIVKRIQETQTVVVARRSDLLTAALEIGLKEIAEKAGVAPLCTDEPTESGG